MNESRRDFKAREDKIQTRGTPGSKRGSGKKEAKLDSAIIAKTWESFKREDDARDTARMVLHMNPTPSGRALSLSDHEDLSVEVLTERDAPSRDETSGHANRKRKEDTSMDEDEERLAESSRHKKRNIRWKNRTCSTVTSRGNCLSARSRRLSWCLPAGLQSQQALTPANLQSIRMMALDWAAL